MARFLHRLGTFTARRKWVVLGAWLLALVVVVGLVKTFGANTSNNLELPGTDSQEASDLLADRFPPQQNGQNPIVFHGKDGEKVTDSENKQAIEESFAAVKKLPHVYSATSPFSQQGQAQISKDKETAFLTVLLDIGSEDLTEELAQSYLDAMEPARKAGMEVAAGASIGSELSEPATESSEVIGMVAAMIILAFTFGSLVAMGMPLISAVLGLLVGLSLIGLLGHVTEVPTIAPTLATMIGLGVGIDYALFLVSRYRTERAEGAKTDVALATAVSTSGTAIVFAGGTVVIALVSLMVAGIPLVTSLGYASAFAVLTAVLAAVSLLPAVLALVGNRIDSLRLPAFMHPKEKPAGQGFWGRWAAFVTASPPRAIGLGLLILIPLLVPFFSLKLGQEDIGATPKDTTERKAYDLMAAGFGPGYNGPLLIAVELGTPAEPSATFEKQYARAQELQSELETEQLQGQTGAASLQRSADELEAEQARLLAEKAALETKAGDLSDEKKSLQRSARRLKKQRTIIAQLQVLVREAAQLVERGAKLAAQTAVVSDKLNNVRKAQQRNPTAGRLQVLQQREAELEAQLESLQASQAELKQEAQSLRRRAKKLSAKAHRLGAETLDLARAAAKAASEALTLVQQKNKLIQQAANAKVEAAQLQTQKEQLESLQEQAEVQQQQAEKLKTTLTEELTAAGGDERGTDERLVSLQDGLIDTVGVQLVSPPEINKEGDAAVYTLIAATDPADDETADLVVTIRDYVIPQSTQEGGLEVHVGGQTASYVDLADAISAKLFLVILTVIALGFLVLMMAFRSVMIPTQAALANVLSVCAAFGVVTAVFQFGWGLNAVGIDTSSGTNPIASFVPLIMFAVLFGLSMDYQVFLMSQIEHARTRAKSDREAVALGLASGARVISAAALIMISVFASFILNGDPTVKQFGVGLSVGVALAAMSVLLLAPALLLLAGHGAWWVPKWADRVLPHIDIEGQGAASGRGSKGNGSRKRRPPGKRGSMKL